MSDFLNKILGDLEQKKEWKEVQARAKALPEEYRTVFDEIKNYIWQGGAMVSNPTNLFKHLVDMFEEGAAAGKHVLDVTGDDVAAFVRELVRGEKTYVDTLHEKLNHTIAEKIKK
jgi:DNA-binding ferritin-like protein (Dps family)